MTSIIWLDETRSNPVKFKEEAVVSLTLGEWEALHGRAIYTLWSRGEWGQLRRATEKLEAAYKVATGAED